MCLLQKTNVRKKYNRHVNTNKNICAEKKECTTGQKSHVSYLIQLKFFPYLHILSCCKSDDSKHCPVFRHLCQDALSDAVTGFVPVLSHLSLVGNQVFNLGGEKKSTTSWEEFCCSGEAGPFSMTG